MKPLGRFCLYIEAIIDVSRRILIERGKNGKGAAEADKFLQYITDERLLQAAMLADAAHETSQIIRFCDKETWDTSEMVDMLDAWTARVTFCFFEDGVLRTQSFTSFMLKVLSKVRTINYGDKMMTIGNHGGVSPVIIGRCMGRMKAWHRLALTVRAAEFPSFEVWGSFSVFKLRAESKLTHGMGIDPGQVERLAKAFSLNQTSLQAQIEDHVHLAMTIKKKDNVDTGQAWKLAVRRSTEHHRQVEKHPVDELRASLKRYRAYNISTSGIEQSFSLQDSLFGSKVVRDAYTTAALPSTCVELKHGFRNHIRA